MKITIIIIKYRKEPTCLRYLNWDHDELQILVRDNTYDNVGFARGVNEMLRHAEGEYIILLNPDTIPLSGWLDGLVKTAESDPRIGIVQPKLVRPNGLLDSTGHEPHPEALFKDRGELEKDKGQYDHLTELPSATFACALIKREVFETVGVFDKRMFLYYEDVDFCIRARKAGWRIIYEPGATVVHDRGSHNFPDAQINLLLIFIKNGMWRRVLRWYWARFLGTLAGAKNRDPEYTRRKGPPILKSLFIIHQRSSSVGSKQ